MAMDFMVPRALYLSSLLFCLIFFTCCSPVNEALQLTDFNTDLLVLESRNGIAYRDSVPFTGRVFKLKETGNDTLFVIAYYKGKEHGEWKRYYLNGQIEEYRFYNKGVKVKSFERWWENGQPQLSCTFKNGEYEGTFKEWNKEGQLTKEMNYKNGYEEGSQKLFYDNGSIRSNYIVRNGKRTGLLGTKNCVNVSDSIFGTK